MAASASAALSICRWNEHARHDMIQSAWMNYGMYFHARIFAHVHVLRACVFSARVCLICMCAHALYFVCICSKSLFTLFARIERRANSCVGTPDTHAASRMGGYPMSSLLSRKQRARLRSQSHPRTSTNPSCWRILTSDTRPYRENTAEPHRRHLCVQGVAVYFDRTPGACLAGRGRCKRMRWHAICMQLDTCNVTC